MMRQALQQAWPERGHVGTGPAIGGIEGAVPRNWRRVVLAWFALSLIIVVLAAEPNTDFPKAQLRSVPAVQTFLRVAGGLTVAGVPVLLIALP